MNLLLNAGGAQYCAPTEPLLQIPTSGSGSRFRFSPGLARMHPSEPIRGFYFDVADFFDTLHQEISLAKGGSTAARARAFNLVRALFPVPLSNAVTLFGLFSAIPELATCVAQDPEVLCIVAQADPDLAARAFDRLTKARQLAFTSRLLAQGEFPPHEVIPVWIPEVWDPLGESLQPQMARGLAAPTGPVLLVPGSINQPARVDVSGQFLSFVGHVEAYSPQRATAYAMTNPGSLQEFVDWRISTSWR